MPIAPIAPPTLDILEQLTPHASLRGLNILKKALRLWLTLHSLRDESLDLSIPFTYSQWYEAAIAQNQLAPGEMKNVFETPIGDFLKYIGQVDLTHWMKSYSDRYHLSKSVIHQRLTQQSPFQLRTQNPVNRKRSLENDFIHLAKSGYLATLDYQGNHLPNEDTSNQTHYYRRTPKTLTVTQSAQPLPFEVLNTRFKHVDLCEILAIFKAPINGQQRLFLDLDNVVAPTAGGQLSATCQILKDQVWVQTPVPPIQFTYFSRTFMEPKEMVTYPVSLYYYHRAPYLICYGRSPLTQQALSYKAPLPEITWYNFRLEQISDCRILDWTDTDRIPPLLLQHYKNHTLPTPDHIINNLESAWGFEIGAPKEPLLLRFIRPYHDQYIHQSNRHETFKCLPTPSAQLQYLDTLPLTDIERQQLIHKLKTHATDAYYCAIARKQDNGLVMRLRAWGPTVEVLYPFNLRDRMAQDIQQTLVLYQA